MEQKQRTRIGLSPRRLAVLLGLAVVVLLAVLAVVFGRELGNLLRPSYRSPAELGSVETEDVAVQRGEITEVLRLYGTLQPLRQTKLAFQVAQAEVVDVPVSAGQEVTAGQVLVQLDSAALERQLAKVRNELLEAQRELTEVTRGGSLAKRIELQDQLRKAREALEDAEENWQAWESGDNTPSARRSQAAADLAHARLDLEVLRASKERKQELDQLLVAYNEAEVRHGPYVLIQNPSEQDRDIELILRNEMLDRQEVLEGARLQYEMDIRAAEQAVKLAERAQRDLERELAAGSMEADRKLLQATRQQASARVQSLEAQLEALDENAPDVDVAKAQAKVVKLQGQLADAEAAVSEATLVAPFDGVVNQVDAVIGMVATPGSPLVGLWDMSSLHVLARVNEVDAVRLSEGQEVQLTFEAYPEQTLNGRLGPVPGYGTYENGLTWFDVQVSYSSGDLPLMMGMGANVEVPLASKEDVLLVPAMAVQRDGEGAFVLVVQGKKTERRRVQLGVSDGIHTEVMRGLEEGEVVRVVLRGPVYPTY